MKFFNILVKAVSLGHYPLNIMNDNGIFISKKTAKLLYATIRDLRTGSGAKDIDEELEAIERILYNNINDAHEMTIQKMIG